MIMNNDEEDGWVSIINLQYYVAPLLCDKMSKRHFYLQHIIFLVLHYQSSPKPNLTSMYQQKKQIHVSNNLVLHTQTQ